METIDKLIEKMWNKNWHSSLKLYTKLKCIDCHKKYYSVLQYSEDCPKRGEAQNHRQSKLEL